MPASSQANALAPAAVAGPARPGEPSWRDLAVAEDDGQFGRPIPFGGSTARQSGIGSSGETSLAR